MRSSRPRPGLAGPDTLADLLSDLLHLDHEPEDELAARKLLEQVPRRTVVHTYTVCHQESRGLRSACGLRVTLLQDPERLPEMGDGVLANRPLDLGSSRLSHCESLCRQDWDSCRFTSRGTRSDTPPNSPGSALASGRWRRTISRRRGDRQ